MLPTKGYFQDIECPYFNSSCGRPYCHFRHRKKQSEFNEDNVSEPEKESAVIPTYKPTPKSELANIYNSKSHIPISYVPDLTFRPDRKSRPIPKFEKPTYNPTPLSILSSANKRGTSISDENGEHIDAIKEIKQNIANVEYDPTVSLQTGADIDFEDLSTEFDLIDEIIQNSNDKVTKNSAESDTYNPSNASLGEINLHASKQHKEHKTSVVQEKDPINKVLVDNVSVDKSEKTGSEESKETETSNGRRDKNEIKYKEKEKSKRKEKHEKKDSSKKTNDKSNKEKRDRHTSTEPGKGENEKGSESSHHNKEKSKETRSRQEKKDDGHEKRKPEEKHKKSKSDRSNDVNKTDKKERSHSSSKERRKSKKEEKTKTEHVSEEARKGKDKKNSNSQSKEKHKQRHKRKHSSRSRSRERHKSKDIERKSSHISKEKHKSESRSKQDHKKSTKDDKFATHSDESDYQQDNNGTDFVSLDNMSVDSDLDEDETMLECYRIFNEYKPPHETQPEQIQETTPQSEPSQSVDTTGKKRIAHANSEQIVTYQKKVAPTKPKSVLTPGQMLANRYKLAQQAAASKEQELLMNEMQLSMPPKRPATTLLEAARELKIRKEMTQSSKPKPSNSLIDDILKGTTKPVVKTITKIAPAQNVSLMAKAKERISKIKQTVTVKTVAQTQKAGRVAHVPDVSLSDIPDVLQADKSKLPVNVRTRFLTMIADECVKLYISKDEAFSRALNEEFSCYEKCKVLATYRNSAMLAVNRLRKEIQERNKSGLGLIGLGESSDKLSSASKGEEFYNRVKKWILTEEELDIHGFPRLSEEHHGRAVIKNSKNKCVQNLDENQRVCARCHKVYQVDDDGWPLYEEECCYHPLKKRTIRGEQTYLCCRSSDGTGCATSDSHVSECISSELEGFQTTMEPEYEDDPRSYSVFALDCEMCYTTKGLELTRVTVVDTDCKTVYESLVKPLNPIIDYNTRFSGITKEQMDKTSTSILQIQANILHLCNSKTILVGHSLESDLKALKIVHETVIDTSVLYPHKMGLPHKRALKVLASEYLRKIIQNDVSGHDSAEDAITAMELVKWKVNDECRGRTSK